MKLIKSDAGIIAILTLALFAFVKSQGVSAAGNSEIYDFTASPPVVSALKR